MAESKGIDNRSYSFSLIFFFRVANDENGDEKQEKGKAVKKSMSSQMMIRERCVY